MLYSWFDVEGTETKKNQYMGSKCQSREGFIDLDMPQIGQGLEQDLE